MGRLGSAFPCYEYQHDWGMSLREWYASVAMLAMMINPQTEGGDMPNASKCAREAFQFADIMIAEGSK